MKLYYTPGACSQAVHIALRESGLPFMIEKVDLKAKKTETGVDFKAINPKGYVPALQLDDGQVLTEVQALLQYVGDQKAGSGLTPEPKTMERYRLLEWLAFISTELHKQFGPFFNPTTPEEVKTQQKEKIAGRLEYVNGRLGKTQFLTGDTFSVADGYLFVMTSWAQSFQIDMSKLANLGSWRERVGARPAIQAVLEAEGFKK
jgi:glutathione S-transferase